MFIGWLHQKLCKHDWYDKGTIKEIKGSPATYGTCRKCNMWTWRRLSDWKVY